MEVKSRFTTLKVISLIFIVLTSCTERQNDNNLILSNLYVSKGFNDNKEIIVLSINKKGVKIIDTIKLLDLHKELNFEDKDFRNQIIDKFIISSNGTFVNLKTKEILKDSLGNENKIKSGIYIKNIEDSIYVYNSNGNNLFLFNSSNNTFTKHHTNDFVLQSLNSKPQIKLISPNLDYLIEFSDFKFIKEKESFRNLAQINIKNLKNDKSIILPNKTHSPSLSIFSSSDTHPLVHWIDNENFLFADFIYKSNHQDCKIYKYNINTHELIFLKEIKNLHIKNSIPKFEKDLSDKIYLIFKNSIYDVDIVDNKKTKELRFDLGNNFYTSFDNNFFYIYDYNVLIKKINLNDKILFNPLKKNDMVNSRTSIALIIDKEVETGVWNKELYIWNRFNKEWVVFKSKQLTGVIGYSTELHHQ